jgi:hypothetical protein
LATAGPGQPQQAGQLTGIHGKAELHDRCAEACRFAGDAQVAGAGDLQPAADAGAEDGGDRGVRAGLDRGQRLAHRLVVGQRQIDIGACGAEFLEVAAGGEGRALAAQDDAAQLRVRGQREHGLAQPAPHRGVQCIELVGVEQGDGGNGAVALAKDVGGHGVSRASVGSGSRERRTG